MTTTTSSTTSTSTVKTIKHVNGDFMGSMMEKASIKGIKDGEKFNVSFKVGKSRKIKTFRMVKWTWTPMGWWNYTISKGEVTKSFDSGDRFSITSF